MKKLTYLIAFLGLALHSYGQYDPEALKVLNAMSAKYKKINAFSAKFSHQLVNKDAGINDKMDGEVTVKDEMYVLKLAGQEIYNNSEDVFTFNPEIDEVTIDTYVAENQEISLGNIWDLYQDGFKYSLISVNRAGDRTIELGPEDKEKSYHKIEMIIDKENSLKKFIVYEGSGNQYTYTIDDFQERNDLKDSYFTFDVSKYPNVEVIDFR